MNNFELRNGDCIEQMAQLLDNSVDSIVTDPPYELGFMGKKWDSTGIAYDVRVWEQALRVLKPGGHLIAFSGSRTYHRMAVAIEDAGFEIRDQIMWIYGSGFPKSLNVSKTIDNAAGAEREVLSVIPDRWAGKGNVLQRATQSEAESVNITAPATEAAKTWDGWGTALKPAHEPMVLARKPLIGTVAENFLTWGVGGLNIDGSRIAAGANENFARPVNFTGQHEGWSRPWQQTDEGQEKNAESRRVSAQKASTLGRWPANVIHDGIETEWARYFYCPKTSKRDRNEGLDEFDGQSIGTKGNGLARVCATCGANTLQGCDCPDRTYVNPVAKNHHPTVKPTELMRYLINLVTPPNGTVLDPFTGSGSTGKAAMLGGFNFIGIDLDPDYLAIAKARIEHAQSTVDKYLV